ncbi:MAG: RNA polymerase sigma factor [Pseudomonadales bacterium]
MAGFSKIALDADTASGLKMGDRSAQATAYRVLGPSVMGMAVRILQDRSLAEEVVQDTFVSLIERASTLRNSEAVVAWVRQTAVNHCLMRLRSPWQQRRSSSDMAEELDHAEDADRVDGLHDLERALARLGARTRMVLWLHDVEGYTHKEIGKLFGKTSSYSKSKLARGYQKLLDVYGGEKDVEIARAAHVESAGVS